MKKIVFILAIFAFITTNCEYLRKKGIIGKKKRMAEYIAQLEEIKRDDSIELVAQLEKIKKEAQLKIDSAEKSCGINGTFHVITGSFRNPLNAQNFLKEMHNRGYQSQIIKAPNGFDLVSAYACNNYKDVINALNNIRVNVDPESWLYIRN